MREIKNYEDLLREKLRLEEELRREKLMIAAQIDALQEKFEPIRKIFGFVDKFSLKGAGGSLLRVGTEVGVDMFVRPKLATAGWAARIFIPALIKGVGALFGRRKA